MLSRSSTVKIAPPTPGKVSSPRCVLDYLELCVSCKSLSFKFCYPIHLINYGLKEVLSFIFKCNTDVLHIYIYSFNSTMLV